MQWVVLLEKILTVATFYIKIVQIFNYFSSFQVLFLPLCFEKSHPCPFFRIGACQQANPLHKMAEKLLKKKIFFLRELFKFLLQVNVQ